MPSPTWCHTDEPPIAMAIAAATAEAWKGPETGASNRFREALRKMIGAEAFERIEMRALDLFLLQPTPPEGYDPPPPWAWFEICPGCQKLRRTRHTIPQGGRTKIQVLRDESWLAAQFERGLSTNQVAEKIGCTGSNVVYWAEKHGLKTPKTARSEEIDRLAKQHHAEGVGPGRTAKELGCTIRDVRASLKRQGLATLKNGQVYHERAWWADRIDRDGRTKLSCAREAGIRPHAATYWLKKFGLQELVRDAKRPLSYPELHDENQLRDLLYRHLDNYEAVAKELGCAPSLVSRQARELLGREKKHHNHVPHSDPEWWRERLDAGKTTLEMAEEAGIQETTAREKLRLLGMLADGYANNTRRERERRRGAAS